MAKMPKGWRIDAEHSQVRGAKHGERFMTAQPFSCYDGVASFGNKRGLPKKVISAVGAYCRRKQRR